MGDNHTKKTKWNRKEDFGASGIQTESALKQPFTNKTMVMSGL